MHLDHLLEIEMTAVQTAGGNLPVRCPSRGLRTIVPPMRSNAATHHLVIGNLLKAATHNHLSHLEPQPFLLHDSCW